MRLRAQNIQSLHEFYSHAQERFVPPSHTSLDRYLVRHGLIHVFLVLGSDRVKQRLTDLEFFMSAIKSQDNTYWLYEIWLAVDFTDAGHYYLEQINTWSPKECVQKMSTIYCLQELFIQFNWNDEECLLYRAEITALEHSNKKQTEEYRSKKFFYDYLMDEPHIFLPKALSEFTYLENQSQNRKQLRRCLAYIQRTYSDLEDYKNALKYGEIRHNFMKQEYGINSIEALRVLKDLSDIHSELGDLQQSIKLIDQWFEKENRCFPTPTLERAEILVEMAKAISWDEERSYETNQYLEEALTIYSKMYGPFHKDVREIHQVLRTSYIQINQKHKALSSWQSEAVFIDKYYGATSIEMLEHEIHLIHIKHATAPYTQYEEYQSLYESLDDYNLSQNEKEHTKLKLLYFIISGVRNEEIHSLYWIVGEDTIKKVSEYFQKYCEIVESKSQNTLTSEIEHLEFKIEILFWLNDIDECLKQVEFLEALVQEQYGQDSTKFISILESHVEIYKSTNQFETAYSHAQLIYRSYCSKHGPLNKYSLSTQYQIFEILLLWGHQAPMSAEQYFEDWFRESQSIPSDNPAWFDIYFGWISVYSDLENFEAAEDMAFKQLEMAKAVFGLQDYKTLDTIETVTLYLTSDNDTFGFLLNEYEIFKQSLPPDDNNLIALHALLLEHNPKQSIEDWQIFRQHLAEHSLHKDWYSKSSSDVTADFSKRLEFLSNTISCLVTLQEYDDCAIWIDEYYRWFESEESLCIHQMATGDLTCEVLRFLLHTNEYTQANHLFNKHIGHIGMYNPPLEPLVYDRFLRTNKMSNQIVKRYYQQVHNPQTLRAKLQTWIQWYQYYITLWFQSF